MNKNGQVLIVFVILIPLIVLALSIIVELSIIAYNQVKLDSLTKEIITNTIDRKEKNDIIELYNKNDIKDDIEIITSDNSIEISFNTKVKSFLGKIINKDTYNIHVSIKGTKINNKIKFEKGQS